MITKTKCSEEQKKRAREYYWKNRESVLNYKKRERQEQKEKLRNRKTEHYLKNRDEILKKKRQYYLDKKPAIAIRKKKYYEANKEKYLDTARAWREKNKEHLREYLKKNKPQINLTSRIKWRNDPKAKIARIMRTRISVALKNRKGRNHWQDLVGYKIDDLILHLESQFKDGMNWENHGKWHIDHILPVSSFRFKSFDDSEFKECWALKNLQPLWARENHIKYNKIIGG